MNVAFLDQEEKRHVYQFSRGQDSIKGDTKFDAIESGQNPTGVFGSSGHQEYTESTAGATTG